MIWAAVKGAVKKATQKKTLKPLERKGLAGKIRVPVLSATERMGNLLDNSRDYVGQRLWNFMGGMPEKYPGFLGTQGFSGGMAAPQGGVVPYTAPAGEEATGGGKGAYSVVRPRGGGLVIN